MIIEIVKIKVFSKDSFARCSLGRTRMRKQTKGKQGVLSYQFSHYSTTLGHGTI